MPNTLPTGAGLLALLAILGIFEASQNAANGEAADQEPGDEREAETEEIKVNTFTTDTEARASFLADNRDVIENEAVAIVVLAPNADGELRARVLSTHGACAYEQGIVLLDVAEEVGRTHDSLACADRRRAKADARN